MADEAFADWVQHVINTQFGGKAKALAAAIGVSSTTTTRLKKKRVDTLDVDTLLRLAAVSGRDASEVLRLAGKAELDALIQQCYGEQRLPMDPSVREFAALVPQLPSGVVWAALAGLRVYRDALLQQSGEGSAPSAPHAGERRRRATRGALKK